MKGFYDFISLGGGAAGVFAAIQLAERKPSARVAVFEAGQSLLSKLRVSGGGRCNVTHDCEDIASLAQNYPRGSREVRSALSRFGPSEMRAWLKLRGVPTKVEPDGRVFPCSDSSSDIIQCFLSRAKQLGVELYTGCRVQEVHFDRDFMLIGDSSVELARSSTLLLATGSSRSGKAIAQSFGHKLIEDSPSLFSLNLKTEFFNGLEGTSLDWISCEPLPKLKSEGPAVVTHWGLSGPAILKASAFGAVDLKRADYRGEMKLNFLPKVSDEEIRSFFESRNPSKKIVNEKVFGLTHRFWSRVVEVAEIDTSKTWSEISKRELHCLIEVLKRSKFSFDGKTTNKEEFVTAGGVAREEIDFKSMQSKIQAGLFLAGEMIDVDAVTGGFNFQACWSEAVAIAEFIAQSSHSEVLKKAKL